MPDEPNAMMNWGYALMKLAQMEHRPDVYAKRPIFQRTLA
jgi:hypothetical protein